MPVRPAKPCAWPGCRLLVRGVSHCSVHKPQADARRAEQMKKAHQQYNTRRDESDAFYKTERWRKFRAYYLRLHPLCVQCTEEGRTAAAVILDHIKPYKTHPELGLDWHNVRPLCRACHNRVGARVGLTGEGGGQKSQ